MRIDSFDKSSIYKYAAVLVSVGLILFGCLIVLSPFLPALLLAVIFCVSTWPAFQWLQRRMNNRTGAAAFLMTLMLAAFLLAPLIFLGSSLVENFHALVRYALDAAASGPHELPSWITSMPVVGPHLQSNWESFTADRERMNETMRQYVKPVTGWLIVMGSGIGHGVLQVALGVFISFFLFQNGIMLIGRLRALIEKFGGTVSLRILAVTESTMISLIYGILGTALIIAVISTICFYIAGVPGAPFLGLLTFLLGIVPGGPPLVLIPVTVWLFYMGSIGMGIFMAAWLLASIGLTDVVIRPYFISLGTKMPVILILLGVFGGVIAFGFIGLFIGPALLSVAYAMITEWSQTEEQIVND